MNAQREESEKWQHAQQLHLGPRHITREGDDDECREVHHGKRSAASQPFGQRAKHKRPNPPPAVSTIPYANLARWRGRRLIEAGAEQQILHQILAGDRHAPRKGRQSYGRQQQPQNGMGGPPPVAEQFPKTAHMPVDGPRPAWRGTAPAPPPWPAPTTPTRPGRCRSSRRSASGRRPPCWARAASHVPRMLVA